MINSSFDSYNLNDIFYPNENYIANLQDFNSQILENQNNYHESRTENQSSNNLLSSFNNYNSINNNNDDSNVENEIEIDSKDKANNFLNYEKESEDNLININNSFKEEEKNKFILYLKENNYIKNKNIYEKDILINKDKKKYEQNMLNIMNKLKCKSCLKIPNEFFICSLCNNIFCENCLGREGVKNKNCKFCIGCNRLVTSKDHFIKLPIFNKIMSYINKTKENNEKLFDNRIKEFLDKNIVLCGDDIHKVINKEDYLKIDINDIKNGELMNNQIKAVYFCMECLKPFCSDCILNYKLIHKKNPIENIIYDSENDNPNKNDMNKKHNFTHPIFKIDLLKDIGIFDLLYEKGICAKLIDSLSPLDKIISDKIEKLDNNKQNMILFFDYIKNVYIGTIDEIIINLKNIAQERKEKIEIINKKIQELSNFLKTIKSQKDLKNLNNIKYIKQVLNDLNSFHKIPSEIIKKSSKFINFKGAFDLEELTNFTLNFNPNKSLKKKIFINNNNSNIKMKYENKNIEQKENNENNNNMIIEEKKVTIVYNKENEKFNKNNKKYKNCYSYPILINNNLEKVFLKMSETKNKKVQKNINKIKEDEIINYNYEEDNDNLTFANPFRNLRYERKDFVKEMAGKKYMIEINIKDLKKLNDDFYNINFDIYNFNIF